MAGVAADPDKLRDLARRLVAAAQQLEGMRSQVTKALASSNWTDSERHRFEQELSRDLHQLQQVAQRLHTHYPGTLQRKAAALDQFRR